MYQYVGKFTYVVRYVYINLGFIDVTEQKEQKSIRKTKYSRCLCNVYGAWTSDSES